MSARLRHQTVADVMTTSVHVACPLTPSTILARLIEENKVSAIPIVDLGGIPVGVVSKSDLLLRQGWAASEVMTSPPITIRASVELGQAARLMQSQSVRRLIVVDELGRISGIVSRSDLLRWTSSTTSATSGTKPMCGQPR